MKIFTGFITAKYIHSSTINLYLTLSSENIYFNPLSNLEIISNMNPPLPDDGSKMRRGTEKYSSPNLSNISFLSAWGVENSAFVDCSSACGIK